MKRRHSLENMYPSKKRNHKKNQDEEGQNTFHFKQVCSVCEPTFIENMQENRRRFRRIVAKHWMEMKNETAHLFTITDYKPCIHCKAVLEDQAKKINKEYARLLDTKIQQLMEDCKTITCTDLYKKYDFKVINRL